MNRASENASARNGAPADDEAGRREALTAEDERTRRAAALSLVDAAADGGLAPETVAALAERVRTDPASDVRQFAVEALGVAGTGAPAIEEALDDEDPWVRAESVVALSRAAPGRSERLSRTLEEDDSGWVRRNAVIALGKQGEVSWDRLVDRLKSDPHPAVREYAAQYLPDADGDESETVRLLAAVLAREPNAFVRARAAEGLGELGTERAIEALENHGIEDRSDDVRRTAKHALASARGVDPEDVDVPDPAAPGGGPGSRAEQGSCGPGDSAGPQSGPNPGTGRGPGGQHGTGRGPGGQRGPGPDQFGPGSGPDNGGDHR